MANLLLSVMGAFSEFERTLIRERQREESPWPSNAAHRGRRPALNHEQASTLRRRAADGVARASLAREFGISRETVYQYLRTTP